MLAMLSEVFVNVSWGMFGLKLTVDNEKEPVLEQVRLTNNMLYIYLYKKVYSAF